MSTCIVGGGLAGYLTALRLKITHPQAQITLFEGRTGNTHVAGMRFRTRNFDKTPIGASIYSLYAGLVEQEMEQWINEIPSLQALDNSQWFGPQWGLGKGSHTIKELKQHAESLGIQIITGQMVEIGHTDNRISSIAVRDENKVIEYEGVENLILATGAATGSLFESTNVNFGHPALLVAYEAGLPVAGATIPPMIHPFGKCTENGKLLPSCHPTDNLAGAKIILPDDTYDTETEELLKQHQAHYHFPDIARRFWQKGGQVKILMPDGTIMHAKVAIHGYQLGIATDENCRVTGIENVWAIGDAGSWQITGYQTRPPGFGLLKCALDADNVVRQMKPSHNDLAEHKLDNDPNPEPISAEIRALNTRHMLGLTLGGGIAIEWLQELNRLGPSLPKSLIQAIVKEVSQGWNREPTLITREQQLGMLERGY